MENNVISFEKKENNIPTDLMTFKELELKYGFKYGYLYKWSCLSQGADNKLTIYSTGKLKLSEKEVLEFEANKRAKKYGRYQ